MLALATSAAALRRGDRILVVDSAGNDCLEVIGASRVRHESHVPSFQSLERVLAAARAKHRDLGAQCVELEQPSRVWAASELRHLKKQRLREKDKIENVLAMMRRHPKQARVRQLGTGNYGEVLLGRSEQHGLVAVKVVPHDDDESPSQLAREAALLTAVDGAPGFPTLIYHGTQEVLGRQSDVLVLELLGPSLEDLIWKATGGTRFSTATVLRLGRELLCTLRALHAAGYVHNDLKPSNVLLGASGSGREGTLHLVDFGISTRAGEAVPAGEIYGTPLFASVAAHAGRPTTPMDDIESLCYCLAFLAAGSLPWERRPPERAAALKLGMLAHATDDAPGSSPLDPSSFLLTQDVPGADLREALRDVWSHVVACRAAPGGEVDYAMCLKALGGEASATAVYDWERASEPIGDRS